MFQAFYESFWQHPLLLWLFPVVFLVVVRPGGSLLGRAAFWFSVLAIVDPLMTGPVTEWLELEGGASDTLMIVFVLIGDFRFFFFVEHWRNEKEAGSSRASVRALLFTLIVPILQAALIGTFEEAFHNPRYTFLAYELLFLVLAVALRLVLLKKSRMDGETRSWLSSVFLFAMTYYALWVLADILILAGFDSGYLLRVVPNVLYYGLFIPFVFWKAPRALKE